MLEWRAYKFPFLDVSGRAQYFGVFLASATSTTQERGSSGYFRLSRFARTSSHSCGECRGNVSEARFPWPVCDVSRVTDSKVSAEVSALKWRPGAGWRSVRSKVRSHAADKAFS